MNLNGMIVKFDNLYIIEELDENDNIENDITIYLCDFITRNRELALSEIDFIDILFKYRAINESAVKSVKLTNPEYFIR